VIVTTEIIPPLIAGRKGNEGSRRPFGIFAEKYRKHHASTEGNARMIA
jgi:hypothetical protein